MLSDFAELIISVVVFAFCLGMQAAVYKDTTALWQLGKMWERAAYLLLNLITSLVSLFMLLRVAIFLVELFN